MSTTETIIEVVETPNIEAAVKQDKWDRFYLGLAKYYSTASKDPSTKVGAIAVEFSSRQAGRVVGLGYNGFPPGVDDDPARYEDRPTKYKLVTHAEVNACADAGHLARGATLYVYPSFMLPPICNECCKVAIAAGIKEVVGYYVDPNDERAARWKDSIAISKLLCDEAGVSYRGVIE